MNSKNYNPTASRIVEARKEGQYVRATTWSKKGKSKCPKESRRIAKKDLQSYW